jgi:uncharacterized protein involved in response to NO
MPGKKGPAMSHSRFAYFFSQPHQPFFLLGFLNAIIVMALFIPAYRGGYPSIP